MSPVLDHMSNGKDKWNCHSGNVLVTKEPFPIYCAGWSRGFHKIDGSILLDLADVISEPKVSFINMDIPKVFQDRYTMNCEVIRISWPDGGIPKVSGSFWYNLAEYLVQRDRPVIIACMGGHGRTGTALALLGGIYNLHGEADLGEWVRAHHCRHAIETYSQLDYIEDTLGISSIIEPSWSKNAWTASKQYHTEPCKECSDCGTYFYMESTTKCFKCGCEDLPAIDSDLEFIWNGQEVENVSNDEGKIFGYFDHNDVYHTGSPNDTDEVSCVVKADREGNDIFEYIYDKDSDEFLPTY